MSTYSFICVSCYIGLIVLACANVTEQFAYTYDKDSSHPQKNPSHLTHEPTDSSGNIVGGVESIPYEFPWMIGIQFGIPGVESHACGASIVNSRFVVTAAHCVHETNVSLYTLIAGDHNNTFIEGKEQFRNVIEIVNHPQYNPSMYENDIALLQVAIPFIFNEYVQPVPLATSNFTPTETQTAIGWGRLAEYGDRADVLMKVDIPFVSDELCRVSYGASRIKDSMICAGTEGRDACQGDSGGALLCKYGKNSFLCGITSFGNGCARPNFPGVFTEVSYYAEWINRVLESA